MKITRGIIARPPSGGTVGTTWNPGDKSSDITLSMGDLFAEKVLNNASPGSVRATTAKSAGSWYFEVESYGFVSAGQAGAGLGSAAAPLGNVMWFSDGIAYVAIGGVYLNNAPVSGAMSAWTSGGSVAQFAVNLSTKRFWAKLTTDANWNGSGAANPATGVGGIDFSAIAGPYFPMLTLTRIIAIHDSALGNFGASPFVGTPPAGFSAWG